MSEQSKALLIFNGVKHHVHLVQSVGGSGPNVGIAAVDIDMKTQATFEPHDDATITGDGPILFYKWEGKYVVLLGRSRVENALADKQATIKGRLISTPGLKKARIVTAAPASDPAPASNTPVYENSFANRPRFTDERTSRYAGNSAARYPNTVRKGP